MKTLQENLDTVEDCRAKKYENSEETDWLVEAAYIIYGKGGNNDNDKA